MFPSHLDAALGLSLTQRPLSLSLSGGSGNHRTVQILQITSCLFMVQSPKIALGRPARCVQAGGEMEVSQLSGPGPSAVGKVGMRTCEKREPDCAPLMVPC